MLCLDYRACVPRGKPQVVRIDQERDCQIVLVAENFEAFIRGLKDDAAFDGDGEQGASPDTCRSQASPTTSLRAAGAGDRELDHFGLI